MNTHPFRLRTTLACTWLAVWGTCLCSGAGIVVAQTGQTPDSESTQASVVIVSEEAQLSLTRNITLAAPLAGSVASIHVKEGDVVQSGDALAQLDGEIAEAELTAAEAAYEAARLEMEKDVDRQFAIKSLEVRQRELELSEQANDRFAGSVTETEIAKLRLVTEQSRLAIEQAIHEQHVAEARADEKAAALRISQAKLNKHRLVAPSSGIVAEVYTDVGEWMEPGKPLIRLISLDPIRVECFVDGREHGIELLDHEVHFRPSSSPTSIREDLASAQETLHPNDQAIDAGPKERVYHGRVVFVSSELHPVTGQARIWAEIDNADLSLRSGMQGRLDVLMKVAEIDGPK